MARNRIAGSISLSFLGLLIPMVAMIVATATIGYQVVISSRAMQAADSASLACKYAGGSLPAMNRSYLEYYKPTINVVELGPESSLGCEVKMSYSFTGLFNGFNFTKTSYAASSNSTEIADISETSNITPTEMVLVLDISSSMFSSIDTVKSILENVVDNIDANSVQIDGRGAVSMSVVPFSDGVSVINAPWLNKQGVYCVDGIQKNNGSRSAQSSVFYLDATHSEKEVEHRQPDTFLADCSESSPTLPLTDNLTVVKNAIKGLDVSGSTASYQGLIWAARQLIPRWQSEWRLDTYRTQPAKKIVLMTDGADNDDMFDQLVDAGLCERLADDFNIQLNFIGFNVSGSRLNQFERCVDAASNSAVKGRVFSAYDNAELQEYFSEILKVEYDLAVNFNEK
ncbi:hypothetical protein F0266_11385 [Vibrio coralliilyticus]|uniref:VWA domain-containing protein n=1 Tax=Vibrio coralliilyticus TaxID=190893 RepID=UPI00148C2A8D|nr:VWA domain-containing protein [Vibrio coralliilyticus]NOH53537.1 hypothetical protein [Vibrio coralliilyticus]